MLAPQIAQQEKHWETQLRPMLWSELEMIRRACGDLPPEARRRIADAGNKQVAVSARQIAEMQFGLLPQRPEEAIRALRTAVTNALKPSVTAENLAVYEAETAARRGRSDSAARQLLVVQLDERLLLSTAQREAIEADLQKNWQPVWAGFTIGHFRNNQMMAPDAADKCIAPHLEAGQKAEWKSWCEQAGFSRFGIQPPSPWPGQNGLDVSAMQPDPWWAP